MKRIRASWQRIKSIRCISNSGVPDALEGIVEDVTEVRALERRLQQAQEFETIGQLAG